MRDDPAADPLLIPDEYAGDLRAVRDVYDAVEQTHPGLGKLMVAVLLHDRADMALFIVGLAGSGKSKVTDALLHANWRRGVQMRDLTKASLAKWGDDLQNFNGTIVIDDLARTDSEYIMQQTYKTLIELCFNHGTDKATFHYRIQITNFYAAVIMNCQPVIFRRIIGAQDWDAFIRDRAARFYHIIRPVKENPDDIQLPQLSRLRKDDVKLNVDAIDPRVGAEAAARLSWQFSRGRAKLHLIALLKASAALNNRTETTTADAWLIREIYSRGVLEHLLTSAAELEGRRRFNSNLYALISEFATLRRPITVKELAERFGYSTRTIYNIARRLRRWVVTDGQEPSLVPTQELVDLMREAGVAWQG
jgi:hypothetical protein